jgi:predicted esterase
MTSKNWPNGFARACAATSLLAGLLAAQPAANKAPAIALVDAADVMQWQNLIQDAGWRVIAAETPPNTAPDQRALALAARVEAEIKAGSVDPSRIYLAGRGDASALVFYTVSRVPDLWAAAAAVGGSPRPAIDSGRLWAANFTNTPLLWVSGEEGKEVADRLKAAKMNVEWRAVSGGASGFSVIEWLAAHKRDDYPREIDCETNSPQFARCYWIQMTKFDPAERNDVLEQTRLAPSAGAALDLGAFGFKREDPGPGVLVSYLPEKYSGPLKLNDRIVQLDGRNLTDVNHYLALMEKITEEKTAVIAVQRGKERIRIETHIVLPRRDAGVTARVQAQYLPAEKEIQIVSRTLTEMRVTVPAEWLPASILWNGLTLENLKEPGCWLLTMQKELLRAEKCK